MFDLSKATKLQLVTLVQEIQSYAGEKSLAASTLARSRNEDLMARIRDFILDHSDHELSEDGHLALITPPVTQFEPPVEPLLGSVEDEAMDPPEGTRRGRTPTHSNDAVITVTFDTVPGRPGSSSYGRRELFKSGMTVGEFVAAAGKKGRGSLCKAIRRGWVKVSAE